MNRLIFAVVFALAACFDGTFGAALVEQECKAQGGICVQAGTCPEGRESIFADILCGADSSMICCHSVSLDLKNCSDRGGQCATQEECGRAPKDMLGECPESQVCCIHV